MRAFAAFGLVAACSLPSSYWLPAPRGPNRARVAIIFLESGPNIQAQVAPLDDAGRLTEPFQWLLPDFAARAPETTAVTMAYYDVYPEMLGVPLGFLGRGDLTGCLSLQPIAILGASATGTEWLPIAKLSDTQAQFLVGDDFAKCDLPNSCYEFTSFPIALGDTSAVQLAFALSATEALVATVGAQFYRVTREGMTPVPALAEAPARAVLFAPDGSWWLGGQNGKMARANINGVIETLPSMTSTHTISALAGDLTVSPPEVYALSIRADMTKNGTVTLSRYSPNGWKVLAQVYQSEVKSDRAEIAYLGQGHLIAVYNSRFFWELKNNRVTTFSLPDESPILPLALTSITQHPQFGLYAGATDGRLYQTDDGRVWGIVPGVGIFGAVEEVHPVPGGFLYGSLDGVVGQYFPGGQLCPARQLASSDVELIVPVGESFLVAGGNITTGNNIVTWLRPFRRE